MPISLKLLGIGLLTTIIGFFWAASDLRMKWSGKKTMAKIMDVDVDTRTLEIANVHYVFPDETGVDRSGYFHPSRGWRPPADNQVEVIFFAGRPETVQLATASGWTGVLILFGGIAVTAVGFVVFNRTAPRVAEDL